MRSVPVSAHEGVAPGDLDRLAGALAELRTLGDVLASLRAQDPPRAVSEIVTQDEYTHDVIVRWTDELWLAFDTT